MERSVITMTDDELSAIAFTEAQKRHTHPYSISLYATGFIDGYKGYDRAQLSEVEQSVYSMGYAQGMRYNE